MQAAREKTMGRAFAAAVPARWQGLLNWLALAVLVALCFV
jgi:hypothetical protein